MVKKNFSQGIDAFFIGEDKQKSDMKDTLESDPQKLEKRATFIVEVDLLEKIKALAYWERKTAKSILKQSLENFFSSKGDQYIAEAVASYRNENQEDNALQ